MNSRGKFTAEINRLQAILSKFCLDDKDTSKMLQKAKAEPPVIHSYEAIANNPCEEEPIKKKRKKGRSEKEGKNEEPFDLVSSCILTYYT